MTFLEDVVGGLRPGRERLGPPLIAGVLGINLWIGLMGLPLWHLHNLDALSRSATAAALLSLLPLGAGVALLALRRRGATETLLLGVPGLMLFSVGLQPTLVGPSVFSPLATAMGGASFAGYIFGVCWATNQTWAHPIEAETSPLEDRPSRARWLRAWLLLGLGALVAAQVIAQAHLSAPAFPDPSLGPLARWRVVILSAGALLIWSAAFFLILSPALRYSRPRPLAPPSRGAAVVWMLVVALAFTMLLISSIE